ncbi:FAD-binding domain protein [Cooperia oncophora]
MCDVHGNGRVRRSEFAEFVRSLNAVVGVSITESSQNHVIENILYRSGKTASLSSFAVSTISEHQCLSRNVLGSIAAFIETYRQHIAILFIFCCINIIVFLERFWHYRYETEHRDLRRVMGAGIAITRGAAGALSFCMAVVLLTVCRNVITLLRETPIGEFIPFDSAIAFHKSPKFWYYAIGPVVIFIIDRIMGMRQEYKKLKILNAELLPSDIIYLQFKRPLSFSFRSGQWVRISSPAFSCAFNECHAFSLASAPQSPTLELYIKAVGPWTWKMRSEIIRAQASGSPYPLVHMNGPYGDGNQEWTNYEVAILIGGGIGVTPYASTLTDLVLETTSGRHHKVKCKKVYFLWICPTHKNYEWFVDVLKDVEELDENRLLETHIFVTQFFHKFDLRTTMLYICEKHFRGDHQGKSMFTGLRAHNHFGRPNFRCILLLHPECSQRDARYRSVQLWSVSAQ